MPISTRGRVKDTQKAVPISPSLLYGFLTFDLSSIAGISSADIVALGQVDPSSIGAGQNIIFGAKSPYPASFRKKVTGGNQDSVSSFGDGSTPTAIATARAAGWNQTKAIRRASLGGGKRMTGVGVELSNGLIVVALIPTPDVSAGNGATLGWDTTIAGTKQTQLVRGANNVKAARVRKTVNGVTLTYPCATAKLAEANAAGWATVSGEKL